MLSIIGLMSREQCRHKIESDQNSQVSISYNWGVNGLDLSSCCVSGMPRMPGWPR